MTMINDLILYAANRAAHGAVDNVARKVSWGGFAVFMLLAGTVFSLIVMFWVLNVRYDAATAGAIVATGCFVIALACLSMPQLLDWRDAKAVNPGGEAAAAAVAVKEEVDQAVDYFGPVRVIGSAFMLGLGVARKIKRR
jgi:hypothetical protein